MISAKQPLLIFYILLITAFSSQLYAQNIESIIKTEIYKENNTDYLCFQLLKFKPTSQAYSKGNISSTGFSEQILVVYNLENGAKVAEKSFGKQDSTAALYVLGHSPGNLWVYSKRHKSGLQSIDPLTLTIKTRQAKIYASLNASIGRFFDPKWNAINSYYGFDPIQHKLIITNTDSVQYYIDAQSFAVQPILEKINIKSSPSNSKASTVAYKNKTLKLNNYEYLTIKWGDSIYTEPSFLYGQYLLNTNKRQKFAYYSTILENIVLDSHLKNLTTNSDYVFASQNIDALIRGFKADDLILLGPNNSFFVIEKSKKAGNAVIKLNNLSINNGVLTKHWDKAIDGMFYNIYQARESSEFKVFFGDFMPSGAESQFYLIGHKLVIIYLNQICCLDAYTGNILWQNKIK